MRRLLSCGLGAVLLVAVAGCRDNALSPGPETPPSSDKGATVDDIALADQCEAAVHMPTPQRFGDPIRGLPGPLLARFEIGLDEFQEEEDTKEGLGPVFNDVSCVACHAQGGIGGGGDGLETRFGKRNPDGSFDPLAQFGGSLLQAQGIVYPDCSQPAEQLPAEANVVAQRQTTPLFGLGLLEAVPAQVLRLLADPLDRNRDGISGRVNVVTNPVTGRAAIGRFGWKAQVPTVLAFSGDAYLNEMGITSTIFPEDSHPNGQPPSCDDEVEGIEDEDADGSGVSDNVEQFADFMRLLAPPPVAGFPSLSVLRGARLFATTQCAACHQPVFVTSDVAGLPALSRRVIYPFSDLLLHDMGALGDGIEQGQAKGSEMRTAPLWGLRESPPYLHDGRAATIGAAIEAHDGEAARARQKYLQLSPQQRDDLLAFLGFI
jgi:CxxC motif-containing protein (DUF1111 family)